MAKALKVNPMEKDLPLSYTKHYYIGSERVSAKTGTMDKLGYYPLYWVTSEMSFLNIAVQDNSASRFVKAADVVASINQLFGSSLPALNTTDNYIDLYDATHYLEKMDVYYFHPDHLGSSSYITNMAGMVSQHMEYLPFGELLVDEHKNSYNSPFKYNGKEFDEETGNYFYGARYYDPKWSIFINVDPLAEKFPAYSSYNYTLNNPINLTDPDGRAPKDWKKLWQAIKRTLQDSSNRRSEQYDNMKRDVSNAKKTIVEGAKTVVKETQKFVKENKQQILAVSKSLQDSGEETVVAGLTGAAVGAPIAGVGAAPGLAVAAVGGVVDGIGVGLEISTHLIAGDYGDAIDEIGVNILARLTGKVVDKAIPGPNPDTSKEFKELFETTREFIKHEASNTAEDIGNNILKEE